MLGAVHGGIPAASAGMTEMGRGITQGRRMWRRCEQALAAGDQFRFGGVKALDLQGLRVGLGLGKVVVGLEMEPS